MADFFLKTNRSTKILSYLGLTALAVAVFFTFFHQVPDIKKAIVAINDQDIKVSLASTPAEQYTGLSGSRSLCVTCGMLFVFPQKQIQQFVMRDMNYPLDIIWISDNKIIKIDANLPPTGSNPEVIYSSELPVNYVLEVNSGYSDKYNLEVGSSIQIIPQ